MNLQAIVDKQGLITVEEAAALAGKSRNTVRRWIRRGTLPVYRPLVTAGQYVRRTDVEQLRSRPPKRGWPEGVTRCPLCKGKMDGDHACKRSD